MHSLGHILLAGAIVGWLLFGLIDNIREKRKEVRGQKKEIDKPR
jgi:hypothetical protein